MMSGELARRAERLLADRVPFAVATVVRAQRPTSVRAGDRALVLGDGTIEGFVGGMCASASVRLHALRVLETGEPLLLRLIPGRGENQRSAPRDKDTVVVEHNPCLSGGSLEIFLEPQLPAPRATVVGDSPIARAVETLVRAAEYEVVRSSAEEARPQAGDAAVIVASHGTGEERVLADALLAGVPYVALVASRVRGEAVRAALEVPDELRDQLHTPAGLDLGARAPSEVAVAILAELIAERHKHLASQAPPPAAAGKPAAPRTVATAVDPVCGMEVAATDATPHLGLPGGQVFFCSEHCREMYASQHLRDAATH